jgi:hypothetical protein
MAAVGQQINAEFPPPNILRDLIRPIDWQHSRAKPRPVASLVGVLGWGFMPCTISGGLTAMKLGRSATLSSGGVNIPYPGIVMQ